ncbi:MAG TPA: hypothetical protein VM450_19460 [Thermomicrobiales bacterium]|nr:hypothetical protein [Thermomicrobiales bacterium]
MPEGYSRSPKLLKGALVQFSAPFLVPVPNVIIFQYNPETLSRTLTPWTAAESDAAAAKDQPKQEASLTQPYDPGETFTLTLELDATDALEEPESHPVAVISGVADRIAALEMLLYPEKESALGALLNVSIDVSIGAGGISASAGAKKAEPVPRSKVPVVLFVWGPGRIVPVRLSSFQVEEQAFSPILYPIRAKVSVGLTVLSAAAFPKKGRTASEEIAVFAATYTRTQKEVLAMANLANSVESILGMLPF